MDGVFLVVIKNCSSVTPPLLPFEQAYTGGLIPSSGYRSTESWGCISHPRKLTLTLSFPCRVVKEEISDDNAKLPCFNGRVVSWVRSSPQPSLHLHSCSELDGGKALLRPWFDASVSESSLSFLSELSHSRFYSLGEKWESGGKGGKKETEVHTGDKKRLLCPLWHLSCFLLSLADLYFGPLTLVLCPDSISPAHAFQPPRCLI